MEEGRELVKGEKRRRERLQQSSRGRQEPSSQLNTSDNSARQRTVGVSDRNLDGVRSYNSASVTVDMGDTPVHDTRRDPPRNLFDDL